MTDETVIRAKIAQLQSKRDVLLRLLEQPNLGTLRIDVNQAIEELDEVLEKCSQVFTA
jgi:hypothetical protein